MPIEINGADAATVDPIREALMASQKSRSLRFPAGEDPPASAELPGLAARAGRTARFDSAGQPYAEAGHVTAVRTVTEAATLTVHDGTVFADATAAAITLTLPPAGDVPGRIYTVKKTDAGGNLVTLDPDGSETIDGAATQDLAAGEALQIQSDGTAWHIIGGWSA